MIILVKHAAGVILPVRAQPGARRNGIVGAVNGSLKVAVTAPPQDGRANQAIIEVLARALGLKPSQIELLSGQKGREKRFLLRGVFRADVEASLLI